MAAKKKSIFQGATDILAQGLISVKKVGAFFKQTSRDKRTVSSTKRAAAELQEGRTPKEVAQSLGISTQKWTAVKKKIQKGEVYGPEVRDTLKSARKEYSLKPQKLDQGVYYFPDLKKLKQKTHVDLIRPFEFLEDAIEWWKGVVKSNKFIAIAEKDGLYYVVGLGTRSQRPQKGKTYEHGAGNRVSELISKYPRDDDDDEDDEE